MQPEIERQTVIHRHSGWLIPLGFGLALLLLCSLVLAWYLRPGPGSGFRSDTAPVILTLPGMTLAVPANHVQAVVRRKGEVQSATLFALHPSLRGFSQTDAALFAGDAPDSPVLHLMLKPDPNAMDAEARLERLYRPYLADGAGSPGPSGLTHYAFRSDGFHGGDELFVGKGPAGPLLILCERKEAGLASPNCLASGNPPARDLSLSFRFKRAWLPQWRQIAAEVNTLMARFERAS